MLTSMRTPYNHDLSAHYGSGHPIKLSPEGGEASKTWRIQVGMPVRNGLELLLIHWAGRTVKEIPHVIRTLTQTAPHVQRQAIETYFAPNASFIHPFCRTGSFPNSREVVWMIYRWYKIMSPRIDLTVHSVGKFNWIGKDVELE